jgi:hypothetical protein
VEREPITRTGPFAEAYVVDVETFALKDDGYIATGAIEE